ncbi:MAG: MDR family MFS transporter [Acidimicrobiia bacterium]
MPANPATGANRTGFTQRQIAIILGGLMVATALSALDLSIVNTALPVIAGKLNGFSSYAWVGTAYIVASAIATPLLGKLSDLFGRRSIILVALATFATGSLLCGLARSMLMLIIFRGVQGAGGGAITALSFAVLGDIATPRERSRYVSYFSISFAVATLSGPLVGGFMVQHWPWQTIFLFNVPLALVVMAIVYKALRIPRAPREVHLDYRGAALMTIAIACLMIGIEKGRESFTSPNVVALLAAALAFSVLFVLSERTAREPIVPLRLFKISAVRVSVAINFLVAGSTFAVALFLPLYFQDALFVTPSVSGLRTLPAVLGSAIGGFIVGRRISKTGRYKIYPTIGVLSSGIGLLLISRITGHTSYSTLIVPMALSGLAGAVGFTPCSVATQNAVEFRDLGAGTSTLLFFRSVGGSLGYAIFGALLNSRVALELDRRLPAGATSSDPAKLIRDPATIKALPTVTRQGVVDSLAAAIGHVYFIAGTVTLLIVLVTFLLPEIPLREESGISALVAAE